MAAARTALPRWPLLALGALLLVTLAGTAAVRLGGLPVREADAPPVLTRQLRFEDRTDGGITVRDARSGEVVATLHGEQGFLRGALRALSRERRLRGLGSGPPFELAARADGRLTLADPATGERLDLAAFGPTNAGVFARLLRL